MRDRSQLVLPMELGVKIAENDPVRKLVEICEDLFYQLVDRLCVLGEVRFRNMFVDGTKLEANANRYTFVWKKAVEKNLKKLTATRILQSEWGLSNLRG